MVMEVKLRQAEKQHSPTLVTELGMVMEVKLLQSAYLQLVVFQSILL